MTSANVIIVSTNNKTQENFWQKKLQNIVSKLDAKDNLIIAVEEDWEGGAGNGLGTLYSYCKARIKGLQLYGQDIFELQKTGSSISLYHTAGIGKRLYPITASENNDKSSVKLPSLLDNGDRLTILEAIILQTHQFTKKSPGRLSVFWTDQFFFPSNEYIEPGCNHINIFAKKIDTPSEQSWKKLGLSKYGLIVQLQSNQYKLLEKLDYTAFLKLNGSRSYKNSRWSTSLGSFNLSCEITFALISEFEKELLRKKGKFESDFHFWMPLTLDLETYISLLTKQGFEKDTIIKHFDRMNAFKSKFYRSHRVDSLLGIYDIGNRGFWWDFGSVKNYYNNLMKLAAPDNFEGKIMRLFLNLDKKKMSPNMSRIVKDNNSILIDCNIRSGVIKNSILIGVNAKSVELNNTLIINSNFSTLKADNSLFYNVQEKSDLTCDEDLVRADIFLPSAKKTIKMETRKKRDGKSDWTKIIPNNTISYSELCNQLKKSSIVSSESDDSSS